MRKILWPLFILLVPNCKHGGQQTLEQSSVRASNPACAQYAGNLLESSTIEFYRCRVNVPESYCNAENEELIFSSSSRAMFKGFRSVASCDAPDRPSLIPREGTPSENEDTVEYKWFTPFGYCWEFVDEAPQTYLSFDFGYQPHIVCLRVAQGIIDGPVVFEFIRFSGTNREPKISNLEDLGSWKMEERHWDNGLIGQGKYSFTLEDAYGSATPDSSLAPIGLRVRVAGFYPIPGAKARLAKNSVVTMSLGGDYFKTFKLKPIQIIED